MECLLRNAADVIPIAGTFQAMNNDDDRCVLGLPRLPVTMGEQAGFRIDLKQPGFGRRDVEAPWYKGRHDGHGVAVFQKRVWLKRRNAEFHTKTVFHEAGAHKSELTRRALLGRGLRFAQLWFPVQNIYEFLYFRTR